MTSPMGCTLAALAKAKGLSLGFLTSLGLHDGQWPEKSQQGAVVAPAVVIPYRDLAGNHLRDRYRTAIEGPDRFRWGRGEGLHLYGLWRLAGMVAAGWVLLVEGESDCWTGWHYELPVLGVPGAGNWQPQWASLLNGLEVFAWCEPDQAGAAFVASTARDLPGLRVLGPEGGASSVSPKDLSDAHLAGLDVVPYLEQLKAESVSHTASDHVAQSSIAWRAVAELPDQPDGCALEAALRDLRAECEHLDAIARQAAADQAQRLLKERHVTSPAERVRVALAHIDQTDDRPASGSALEDLLSDPEPWPEEVDGAGLLDELAETLRHYVVMPEGAPEAVALWIVYTHCFDAFDVSPYLYVRSPVKRCGKNRLEDVVGRWAARALSTASVTPASLFRTVEKVRPTLIVDEVDRFLRDNPELNGIVNAGHTRGSAGVLRCVGDEAEPRWFSVWCPKLFAGIGRQLDTLEDRSIVIELQRKRPDEAVARLRQRDLSALEPLRRRCARWAADHFSEVQEADPPTPRLADNDRAQDNWYPLFAIADACGGEWPQRARAVAERLACGLVGDDNDGLGVLLLGDLRDLFANRQVARASTVVVLETLTGLDERPWATYRRGKPLDSNGLSRLLKPFGVQPKKLRITDEAVRGYDVEDCREAFLRYLPALEGGTGGTSLQNGTLLAGTAATPVPARKPAICGDVPWVPRREPQAGPNAQDAQKDHGCGTISTSTVEEVAGRLREIAAVVASHRDASVGFLARQLDLYPAEAESVLDALATIGIVGRDDSGPRTVLAHVDDVDRLVGEYLLRVRDHPGAIL